MDDEDNIFFNSQNFNPTQNSIPYYPSFENFPNSDEFLNSFQHTTQNIPQNTTQNIPQTTTQTTTQTTPQNTTQNTPQNTSQDTSEDISQDKQQGDVKASHNSQVWSEAADMALMSAWCFVSTNGIVGTNQTGSTLWKNIEKLYEKSRAENSKLGEKRTLESLRGRYKRLNANVSKWIGAYKHAHDRATSGMSKDDIENAAQEIYGSKFTHHKVFEKVMRRHPKWELKLNSTGSTRYQPDEDSYEESRGSSKKARTNEDGEDQISTPGSDSSTLQRPIGRNKAKANAKRKGKEVATQSYSIPDDFTATLREMRLTREKECEIQERKMKTSTLNALMFKSDLSPEEEALKRHLMAELYGM